MNLSVVSNNSKSEFLNIVQWYFILLFSSGFYFFESGFVAYLVPLLSVILWGVRNKIYIYKNYAALFGILTLLVIISSVFAHDSNKDLICIITPILTATLAIGSIEKKKAINSFCTLLYLLCVFSSIIYIISIINVSPFLSAPVFTSSGGIKAYFLVLTFVRPGSGYVAIRNSSIFWEPGVFQTMIALAFAFEMSRYGFKRKKYLVAYIIAMITTMSTTGYVVLLLMVIAMLIDFNKDRQLKAIKFIVAFAALLGLFLIVYKFLPKSLTNDTFTKVMDIMSGDSTNISVRTRTDSVINALKSFISSPLIGVGANGIRSWYAITGNSMSTCTPANWLGRYGIFVGGVLILGFSQLRSKLCELQICNIILAIALILSIFTEAYTTNTTIIIFAIWGLLRDSPDCLTTGSSVCGGNCYINSNSI